MSTLEGATIAHRIDEEVFAELQDKFPPRKEELTTHSAAFQTFTRPPGARSISFTIDEILIAARKTNGFTAPGPSGMSMEALLLPLKNANPSDTDTSYIADFKFFIEQIVNGDRTIGDYLIDATLCPLEKPDGGVRPICISEAIRRFASKVLLTKFHAD
jgi:hypothetical protein